MGRARLGDVAQMFLERAPIRPALDDDCFITDLSPIWDFPVKESEEEVVNKVLIISAWISLASATAT